MLKSLVKLLKFSFKVWFPFRSDFDSWYSKVEKVVSYTNGYLLNSGSSLLLHVNKDKVVRVSFKSMSCLGTLNFHSISEPFYEIYITTPNSIDITILSYSSIKQTKRFSKKLATSLISFENLTYFEAIND